MGKVTDVLPEVAIDDKPRLGRPRKRRLQRTLKHVLDRVGAVMLLAIIGPLFALIALCIRLDDGGEVFYRRRVVGQRGEFDAFKFRTMIMNAEAVLNADSELREKYAESFKLKNDPRVTRAGGWLRKYSLDELPQLLNVVQGQMSLVGPRMFTPVEFNRYGAWAEQILSVRPGITGYWQVNGRQSVSFEEHVKMDVYYVENWSMWLDFWILLKTPHAVISGEGAY
jgi:lipopolysaccharide/colanic/teichoic acid biosynthesis glycosyltransferase